MSPETVISVLARLNGLLEEQYHLYESKQKRFKKMQMMLGVLCVSVALVLFMLYSAPALQFFYILLAFNVLFYIGFKPRSGYDEKGVKVKMQEVISLQVSLKKYLMGERVSFDGVECQMDEGWQCDKWGLYKENERIDYGAFLYDKGIKGLYLEALRHKK
jgi:hypothetical protein